MTSFRVEKVIWTREGGITANAKLRGGHKSAVLREQTGVLRVWAGLENCGRSWGQGQGTDERQWWSDPAKLCTI